MRRALRISVIMIFPILIAGCDQEPQSKYEEAQQAQEELAEAREEAAEMIADAEDDAVDTVQDAREEARQNIQQAKEEAGEIVDDAEAELRQKMSQLENEPLVEEQTTTVVDPAPNDEPDIIIEEDAEPVDIEVEPSSD